MTVRGQTRRFRVFAPPDSTATARPLVLALHGGLGKPRHMMGLTRFDALAAREGFVVVYPEGLRRSWNDGRREGRRVQRRLQVDDVAFIDALLDHLASRYPIDPARVYACGMSNGAMMSDRIGADLSHRVAAIGLVAGQAAAATAAHFRPACPVSVVMFNGTADPIVPFAGGGVGSGRLGTVLSAEQTATRWAARDGCQPTPTITQLPDASPPDGTHVELRVWSGGELGTEVAWFVVHGGGHAWPGGAQYARSARIGIASRAVDASALIWRFFADHPRAPGGR